VRSIGGMGAVKSATWWFSRRRRHAPESPAGVEEFDHRVEAWPVGRLRAALDGVPDDLEATALVPQCAGSVMISHEMVVVGAGPDEEDILFDLELEFPSTDLGWSAGRLREALAGVLDRTVIAALARCGPDDLGVQELRVVAAGLCAGESGHRFAIKLDHPSGLRHRPSFRAM
jgi:hypothetical protein